MEGTPRLSAARGKRRLAELRTFARTGEHGPVVIHVQLGTHGYDIQRFLVHGAGRDWQGTSIDGRGGWAEARFPQTLEEGARLLASPAARTWEAAFLAGSGGAGWGRLATFYWVAGEDGGWIQLQSPLAGCIPESELERFVAWAASPGGAIEPA